MRRLVMLSTVSLTLATLHADTNMTDKAQKDKDIKEKVLFKGKDYYDKRLHEKFEKKQEKNSTKNVKVYKRKDGTIDSFKTYNELKKQK